MEAYREDLAYVHDVGFGDFARRAAPGLLGLLRSRGIGDGLVVDLGCGSGIWAGVLLRAGYRVWGVDVSPAMIRLARRRAPEARLVTGSLWSMELPRCRAVTAIGEGLSYRFDRGGSTKLRKLFQRVREALEPGGLFVFDVVESGRGRGSPTRYREGEGWSVVATTREETSRSRLTRSITVFRKVGRHYRKSSESHRLRTYRGADLARELRRVGFRARVVRGYGKLRFAPGQVGLVARKA